MRGKYSRQLVDGGVPGIMAKCKFCGQGVRSGPVFHTGCWEQRANKVMEEFCDEYCRFPREIKDHDNLIEHCSECVAAELLRMGGNADND